MRKIFLLLILTSIFSFGCGSKLSPAETEARLKKSMQDYLYADHKKDSGRVNYTVTDVVYYDDDVLNQYDCKFTVKMSITGGKDTTGYMKANISKDFKKVDRLD